MLSILPLSQATRNLQHGRVTSQSRFQNRQTILLTIDRSGRLVASSNRRRTRIAAKLLAWNLDGQLAEGRSPESSRLLAARAQLLVSQRTRRSIAWQWEHLSARALQPPTVPSSRARINREAIAESEGEIREMCDELLSARPINAKGVAMASRLIEDGTGPVYNRRSADRLVAALRQVLDEMGPQSDWQTVRI
jgi:hypothetical protein